MFSNNKTWLEEYIIDIKYLLKMINQNEYIIKMNNAKWPKKNLTTFC